MAALQTAGIGSMLTLQKLTVFLKKILPIFNTNQVAAYGVTPQEYKAAFDEKFQINSWHIGTCYGSATTKTEGGSWQKN